MDLPMKTILTCDTGLLFLSLNGNPVSLSTLPRLLPPPTLPPAALFLLLLAELAMVWCVMLLTQSEMFSCSQTEAPEVNTTLEEVCSGVQSPCSVPITSDAIYTLIVGTAELYRGCTEANDMISPISHSLHLAPDPGPLTSQDMTDNTWLTLTPSQHLCNTSLFFKLFRTQQDEMTHDTAHVDRCMTQWTQTLLLNLTWDCIWAELRRLGSERLPTLQWPGSPCPLALLPPCISWQWLVLWQSFNPDITTWENLSVCLALANDNIPTSEHNNI